MIKKALVAIPLFAFSMGASAAVVALYGKTEYPVDTNNIVQFLEQNGHTVVYSQVAAPDAAALAGVDAVIAIRSKTGNDAVRDFVLNGGLLITEWSSAEWVLDTAQLLDASIVKEENRGFDSVIHLTDEALAIGLGERGLGTQYSDQGRTEFMYDFTNLGSDVEVMGTLTDGSVVTIGGAAGDGYVLVNGMDWSDYFNAGNHASGQWLLNALEIDWSVIPAPGPGPSPVSEPALPLLLGIGMTALVVAGQRRRREMKR